MNTLIKLVLTLITTVSMSIITTAIGLNTMDTGGTGTGGLAEAFGNAVLIGVPSLIVWGAIFVYVIFYYL